MTLFALRFYADGSFISFELGTLVSMSLLGMLSFAAGPMAGLLHRRERHLQARTLAAEEEKRVAIGASRRESAEKNEDLERANRALASVDEGLESFATSVSRDLKEPVRATTALFQDAEDKAGRDDVKETSHVARTSNKSLARLLTGLLEVARASRLKASELRALSPIARRGSRTGSTSRASRR